MNASKDTLDIPNEQLNDGIYIDSFPLIKVDYADYQILSLAPYPAFTKKSG